MKITKDKSINEWLDLVWQKLLKEINNQQLSITLNSLLSPYEKENIVKRLVAISLIKNGRSYNQIGEELWLSPTTIRSLKLIIENNQSKEYQSYRFRKNKKEGDLELKKSKKYYPEPSPFFDWIDHFAASLPEKHGRRWSKWIK